MKASYLLSCALVVAVGCAKDRSQQETTSATRWRFGYASAAVQWLVPFDGAYSHGWGVSVSVPPVGTMLAPGYMAQEWISLLPDRDAPSPDGAPEVWYQGDISPDMTSRTSLELSLDAGHFVEKASGNVIGFFRPTIGAKSSWWGSNGYVTAAAGWAWWEEENAPSACLGTGYELFPDSRSSSSLSVEVKLWATGGHSSPLSASASVRAALTKYW